LLLYQKGIHENPRKAPARLLPYSARRSPRLKSWLCCRASAYSAIDPCIGDGVAFSEITEGTSARRYGVELDAYRAEQAATAVDELIHGDCLEVHCPVESFGLLFLNPPYDWAIGDTRSERMERVFLAHTYRWLKAGGILILVVPAAHVRECAEILAGQFKAIRRQSPGRSNPLSPAETIKGRPLTPLHGGHVALCAVSGMLNGVFGSGKDRHVAAWQAVKVIDRSEETEDDGTVIV
jgi:Uncharacterised methyltransferase family (DUF6094)